MSAADESEANQRAPEGSATSRSAENPAPAPEALRGEGRSHARIDLDAAILVTPFAGAETWGELHDASLGGVRFRVSGLELREGEILRVSFELGGVTLEGIARVVRTRQIEDGRHEVAVAFERIDPWALRHFEEALAAKS